MTKPRFAKKADASRTARLNVMREFALSVASLSFRLSVGKPHGHRRLRTALGADPLAPRARDHDEQGGESHTPS